ncbi:MAG: glycosyltransferase family 2 protein [Lachnospiraceae bacterium]|nr:glycosyltransferase family 2 protein [Lachnospiraceae bacterium]
MIDIVVPVYNEAENIEKLFNTIEKDIKSPKRVLIVYDMETDNTLPVLRRIEEKYSFQVKLVKNMYGQGALNAIITGMRKASSKSVLVCMADLSDKLDVVDAMAALIEQGYDLVCGSRYMRGGKQHGGPALKSLFSRLAGLSLHFLTGIPTHDATNSFKLYRKEMLDAFTFESTGGFEIGLEIVVKAYTEGYKITEIPSEWFDREAGKSNFHMWRWLPHYLHWWFLCVFHTWFSFLRK